MSTSDKVGWVFAAIALMGYLYLTGVKPGNERMERNMQRIEQMKGQQQQNWGTQQGITMEQLNQPIDSTD